MLRTVAHRAYRRPVSDTLLVDSLAAIDGKTGEALEKALDCRTENHLDVSAVHLSGTVNGHVPQDKQTAVDEYELGERLSYFLWGDMPDQELMQVSQQGRLSDPADLSRTNQPYACVTKGPQPGRGFCRAVVFTW